MFMTECSTLVCVETRYRVLRVLQYVAVCCIVVVCEQMLNAGNEYVTHHMQVCVALLLSTYITKKMDTRVRGDEVNV